MWCGQFKTWVSMRCCQFHSLRVSLQSNVAFDCAFNLPIHRTSVYTSLPENCSELLCYWRKNTFRATRLFYHLNFRGVQPALESIKALVHVHSGIVNLLYTVKQLDMDIIQVSRLIRFTWLYFQLHKNKIITYHLQMMIVFQAFCISLFQAICISLF
jgi:hypothetical protein